MLPDGVEVRALQPHRDHRGSLVELFRGEWHLGIEPVQWNILASGENVLRGVHAHHVHTDYLTVLDGHMYLALYDLRDLSPTSRLGTFVELSGDEPACVVIPPGVAHGFYYDVRSLTLQAVSHYWDTADELGCRWDDPALGLHWPSGSPTVSDRDRELGSLEDLCSAVNVLLRAAPAHA